MHHYTPSKLHRNNQTTRSHRTVAHGDHLREAAGLKHRRHDEHVAAGVDEVAQRLVVGEAQRRAVGVVARQLVAQRVELALRIESLNSNYTSVKRFMYNPGCV